MKNATPALYWVIAAVLFVVAAAFWFASGNEGLVGPLFIGIAVMFAALAWSSARGTHER